MISTQLHPRLTKTADGFLTLDASRIVSVTLFGGTTDSSALIYDLGSNVFGVSALALTSNKIDLSRLGGIAGQAFWLDITGSGAIVYIECDGIQAIHAAITSGQTLVAADNGKGYTVTSGTSTHRLPLTSAISANYRVAFWNQSSGDQTILVPVAQLGNGLVLNNVEAPADGVILNQNEAVFFKFDGVRWVASGNGAATTV